MKNTLQEYFYYTRTERNGLILLGSICLLCYALPHVLLPLVAQQKIDFSPFQAEIAAFEPMFEKENTSYSTYNNKKYNKTKTTTQAVSMFYFNPNTATKEVFVKLGLSEKVAQNIINYRDKIGTFTKVEDLKKIYTLKETDYQRMEGYVQIATLPETAVKFEKKRPYTPPVLQPFPFDPNTVSDSELAQIGLADKTIQTLLNFRSKGGTFRKAADLQKIYGLSTIVFEQLKPYIELPAAKPSPQATYAQHEVSVPSEYSYTTPRLSSATIDINQATIEEWQNLRGIGPYFSKKIVGFRDKLGGFSSIEQVGDTYHFPDSIFQEIKSSLTLSPVLKKIEINTADEKTLAKHPYISYQLAKAIVNYRKQHGAFQNLEDFQKMRVLKGKDVERLSPYLAF